MWGYVVAFIAGGVAMFGILLGVSALYAASYRGGGMIADREAGEPMSPYDADDLVFLPESGSN